MKIRQRFSEEGIFARELVIFHKINMGILLYYSFYFNAKQVAEKKELK